MSMPAPASSPPPYYPPRRSNGCLWGCLIVLLLMFLPMIAAGGYAYPESQTPWQEMQRAVVGQMETGAVLEPAVKYQRVAQSMGVPRDNH